jgi:hypothetical protein
MIGERGRTVKPLQDMWAYPRQCEQDIAEREHGAETANPGKT